MHVIYGLGLAKPNLLPSPHFMSMRFVGEMNSTFSSKFVKVFAVDWSPDGEKVASGGRDRVLKLWMS